MSRKKLDFTLKEVKEELALIATLLSDGIISSFGENFYLSIMNMPLKSFLDNDSEIFIKFTIKDINDAPLAHDVDCAYYYAEGNRYGDTNIPDNFLDGMGEFCQFLQGSIDLIEDSKFKFLFELTSARATLDNEDHLSIKELALLAGVDERTVRNAASSKEANKLKTKKSGGSTIIENDEAKNWLNNRPDFKPTQYFVDTTLDTPRYVEDELGFGKFIEYCRTKQGITVEDLASSIDVEPSVIKDLENGVDRLYINQVSKLAYSLHENTPYFTKSYMRVFHLEELANLLGYEYKQSDNSESSEKIEKNKLLLFKQQLNFEAQQQILQNPNSEEQ